MQIPLQITLHGLEHSEAIESRIRAEAEQLEKYCSAIVGFRVVVERPHRHHGAGNLFHVRVSVTVPGDTLVADREPDAHHAYTDVYVAIRDAFGALRRRVQDYERRRRGQVKLHETPAHGRVAQLESEYGRIDTVDGRSVYFHRDSLVGAAFDTLHIGTEVRFSEEMGERGPQASSVQVIGKHHIVG